MNYPKPSQAPKHPNKFCLTNTDSFFTVRDEAFHCLPFGQLLIRVALWIKPTLDTRMWVMQMSPAFVQRHPTLLFLTWRYMWAHPEHQASSVPKGKSPQRKGFGFWGAEKGRKNGLRKCVLRSSYLLSGVKTETISIFAFVFSSRCWNFHQGWPGNLSPVSKILP